MGLVSAHPTLLARCLGKQSASSWSTWKRNAYNLKTNRTCTKHYISWNGENCYYHVSGVPWRIITGSGEDDWIYKYLSLQSLLFPISYRATTNLPTSQITMTRYPIPGNGIITRTITSNYYEFFLPVLVNHLGMPILQNSTQFLKYLLAESVSESESYVATDGPSASLSWNKAPIWGLRPDFHYSQTVVGRSSLTKRWVCRLQLLLVLASAVIVGSESLGTRDHILLSPIRDFFFRRLLRFAGLRRRYSTLLLLLQRNSRYLALVRTTYKTPSIWDTWLEHWTWRGPHRINLFCRQNCCAIWQRAVAWPTGTQVPLLRVSWNLYTNSLPSNVYMRHSIKYFGVCSFTLWRWRFLL
jgi:hypothetical protein